MKREKEHYISMRYKICHKMFVHISFLFSEYHFEFYECLDIVTIIII